MKIYRGVQDIPYKEIDHNFINPDLTFCDYGPGTSYAYEKELTDDYVKTCKDYAWLITAEFTPKNPLHIYPKQMMDEENMDEGFLIGGDAIDRNEISDYAQAKGYDCIIFEYDDSDPHILLLPNADAVEVVSIELFTEKQEIVNKMKKFKLPFDGDTYQVPLNKTSKVDEILAD